MSVTTQERPPGMANPDNSSDFGQHELPPNDIPYPTQPSDLYARLRDISGEQNDAGHDPSMRNFITASQSLSEANQRALNEMGEFPENEGRIMWALRKIRKRLFTSNDKDAKTDPEQPDSDDAPTQENDVYADDVSTHEYTDASFLYTSTNSQPESEQRRSWGERLGNLTPSALAARGLASVQARRLTSKVTNETATQHDKRPRTRKAVKYIGVAAVAVAAGYASYRATPYAVDMVTSLIGSGETQYGDTPLVAPSGDPSETSDSANTATSQTNTVPPAADIPESVMADTQTAADNSPTNESVQEQIPAEQMAVLSQENADVIIESEEIGRFTGDINPATGYYEGTPYNTIAMELLSHDVDPQEIPPHVFYSMVSSVLDQNGLTMQSASSSVKAADKLNIDFSIFRDYLPEAPEAESSVSESDGNVDDSDEFAMSSTPAPEEPEASPPPAAVDTAAASERGWDAQYIGLASVATASILGSSGIATWAIHKRRNQRNDRSAEPRRRFNLRQRLADRAERYQQKSALDLAQRYTDGRLTPLHDFRNDTVLNSHIARMDQPKSSNKKRRNWSATRSTNKRREKHRPRHAKWLEQPTNRLATA